MQRGDIVEFCGKTFMVSKLMPEYTIIWSGEFSIEIPNDETLNVIESLEDRFNRLKKAIPDTPTNRADKVRLMRAVQHHEWEQRRKEEKEASA